MHLKKIFTFSSSILYLTLVSLFLYYSKLEIICGYESLCIRFCSLDTEEFSDKFLFDEFMEGKIHMYDYDEYDMMNIIRGPPLCNGKIKPLEILKEKENKFKVYDTGELKSNNDQYAPYSFCLERDDKSFQKFIPMICTDEELTVHKSALMMMTLTSIIILVLTLSVYLYYSELRDFKGKMIIFFLVSMIFTYVVIPGFFDLEQHYFKLINLLVALGFSSGNLWLNSMILNIYLRIRDFRFSKPRVDKFASYCTYVAVFTSFSVIYSAWRWETSNYRKIPGNRDTHAIKFITIFHTYFIFVDLVILIITSIKMRNVTKVIGFTERVEFEKEKKIFWIYMKLFGIMSVTWSIQIFALEEETNHLSCVIADLIMFCSAVNVSGIFVGRKKVRNLIFNRN
ncbi:unnamed protein product [Chironomus riparius]|uniref:Uncharacterized protein n=1 Tax=Chironomus riparius TaxID=315576 RepID=A0A9N9RXS6_9DIPT|nr:unnamed protein product [Chironomus riparius]